MGYEVPTFEEQGVTFKLKPTSPRNVKELMDYIEESDIEPDQEDPLMGLGDQYHKVLSLIAEPQDGTMEDIDPMDVNIRKIDSYLQDFMPVGTVT